MIPMAVAAIEVMVHALCLCTRQQPSEISTRDLPRWLVEQLAHLAQPIRQAQDTASMLASDCIIIVAPHLHRQVVLAELLGLDDAGHSASHLHTERPQECHLPGVVRLQSALNADQRRGQDEHAEPLCSCADGDFYAAFLHAGLLPQPIVISRSGMACDPNSGATETAMPSP